MTADIPDHLSRDEVVQIIDYMADHDPIIVGGQSVNLWASYYAQRDPTLTDLGPFTSVDIDIYSNRPAAESLASHLANAQIKLAGVEDFVSPNAATVIGNLGNRKILIDFLSRIMGVDNYSITENYVAIEGLMPESGRQIRLLLMSPMDCVRSRLANINDLHRTDEIAIRQAMVSLRVLTLYISDLLDLGETKHASELLTSFQFVIRDRHLGRTSHTHFGRSLDLFRVPVGFIHDERLDARWRQLTLARFVERLADRVARNEAKYQAITRQADSRLSDRLKS